MDELTLAAKILAEQQEIAEDLRIFLETDKRIAGADIEAIQKNQVEINELIREITKEQAEVQNAEKN
jgi:hypothetical protein